MRKVTFDTRHLWTDRHFFDKGIKLNKRGHAWPLRYRFRPKVLRQTSRWHTLPGGRAECCGYFEFDSIVHRKTIVLPDVRGKRNKKSKKKKSKR